MDAKLTIPSPKGRLLHWFAYPLLIVALFLLSGISFGCLVLYPQHVGLWIPMCSLGGLLVMVRLLGPKIQRFNSRFTWDHGRLTHYDRGIVDEFLVQLSVLCIFSIALPCLSYLYPESTVLLTLLTLVPAAWLLNQSRARACESMIEDWPGTWPGAKSDAVLFARITTTGLFVFQMIVLLAVGWATRVWQE